MKIVQVTVDMSEVHDDMEEDFNEKVMERATVLFNTLRCALGEPYMLSKPIVKGKWATQTFVFSNDEEGRAVALCEFLGIATSFDARVVK